MFDALLNRTLGFGKLLISVFSTLGFVAVIIYLVEIKYFPGGMSIGDTAFFLIVSFALGIFLLTIILLVGMIWIGLELTIYVLLWPFKWLIRFVAPNLKAVEWIRCYGLDLAVHGVVIASIVYRYDDTNSPIAPFLLMAAALGILYKLIQYLFNVDGFLGVGHHKLHALADALMAPQPDILKQSEQGQHNALVKHVRHKLDNKIVTGSLIASTLGIAVMVIWVAQTTNPVNKAMEMAGVRKHGAIIQMPDRYLSAINKAHQSAEQVDLPEEALIKIKSLDGLSAYASLPKCGHNEELGLIQCVNASILFEGVGQSSLIQIGGRRFAIPNEELRVFYDEVDIIDRYLSMNNSLSVSKSLGSVD